MIASHYAEPLARKIISDAALMPAPGNSGEPLVNLVKGDDFALLDSAHGWAWGYAGNPRRAGYVRADAVGIL